MCVQGGRSALKNALQSWRQGGTNTQSAKKDFEELKNLGECQKSD